jgi:hypothetical protein
MRYPRDPARQCRRCPASHAATAAVGRPAGSPAGPRRRDAREGVWQRTRHSGPPGVLPGAGGRFRCLGRRWHRELPHGRARLRDGAVSYQK